MRPEQAMWHRLKTVMGSYWHATRHEDGINQGIPDVSFGCGAIQGWIELKALAGWPKKAETHIWVPHFTPHQRAWLTIRGNMGGHCWLLFKIDQDWLLFHHSVVGSIDGMNKEQLLNSCAAHWLESRLDPVDMKNSFTGYTVLAGHR